MHAHAKHTSMNHHDKLLKNSGLDTVAEDEFDFTGVPKWNSEW